MYKTILADPPWPEYGGGKIKRGADTHYSLMSISEITTYMVENCNQLASANSHLYLWTTNNYLPLALKVMTACNFEYKTIITWVKDRIGLGQYFRGITEHCLFGVRGMVPYAIEDGKRQQGRTVIDAPRTTHSTKPIEIYEMIEKVSQPPYLELFARQKREGWTNIINHV